MKSSGLGIFFFSLIFLFCLCNSGCAGDCEYGMVHAQIQTIQGRWENATTHLLLHPGERFRLKVTVTVKTSLSAFFLKIHEFGTPVFNVVDGPTEMEQILSYRKPMDADQTYTFFWTISVLLNTSWFDGYAPLEIFVQFTKNETDEAIVNFDAIIAYITSETQDEMNYDDPPIDDRTSDVYKKDCSVIFKTIPVLCLFLGHIALNIRVRKRKYFKSTDKYWRKK